jgi:carbonic anhydrase/acetyltransferase-like protein (isoleucine patch superfamily)
VRAVLVPSGAALPPFREAPAALPVLGAPIRDVQLRALADVGLTLADAPPENEPWIAIGDHVWLTKALLTRFLAGCPPTGGQLRIDGPFWDFVKPLQDGPELPIWLVPAGGRPEGLPPVTIDTGAVAAPVPVEHPALAGAVGPAVPVTDAMALPILHWTHLHKANLLALIATADGLRRSSSWAWKLATVLGAAWRAGSLDANRVGAALVVRGKGGRVHPTAVVEGSILGDDVEIGAHAIVRHSWVGAGARIGDQTRVAASVIGPGATVARGANVQVCVLLDGAYVSQGWGHQGCLFGRDSFVAAGVTTYDLSWGSEIRVWHRGSLVSASTRFLGSCIGDRCRIGPHVRLNYGAAVPSDVTLLASADPIARRIPVDLAPGTYVVAEGGVTALVPRG